MANAIELLAMRLTHKQGGEEMMPEVRSELAGAGDVVSQS